MIHFIPREDNCSWMNLRKTRLPWQNYRRRCFFPHHRRFNVANLAEIDPNLYSLPPLWYPEFSFSRNQQSSDGWKSNICSINYMSFIRKQSYLRAEQDNRQEHRHYQENERGEMTAEPWRERRVRAPVMKASREIWHELLVIRDEWRMSLCDECDWLDCRSIWEKQAQLINLRRGSMKLLFGDFSEVMPLQLSNYTTRLGPAFLFSLPMSAQTFPYTVTPQRLWTARPSFIC